MVRVEKLKDRLGYVVGKRYGKTDDLKTIIGKEALDQFRMVGFVKLYGRYWKCLRLGDDYYKDLYGFFSYWYRRLKRK